MAPSVLNLWQCGVAGSCGAMRSYESDIWFNDPDRLGCLRPVRLAAACMAASPKMGLIETVS